MKSCFIIIASPCKLCKVCACLGSMVPIQFYHNCSTSEWLKYMNQDEKDRDNVALLGCKESVSPHRRNQSTPPPTISLEKQCLSCTTPATVALSAFKIACLAYTPSSVVYQRSEFTRKELLEAKQRLLQNCSTNAETESRNILDDIRLQRPQTSLGYSSRLRSTPSPGPTPTHQSGKSYRLEKITKRFYKKTRK